MAPWGARIFHWTRPSGASIFHWTLTLASGWALGTAFTEVVFIHSINGLSMQPALNTNVHETGEKDSVLFWRWQPTRDLKRGQVVSLWQPHNPNGTSVKRVVGLEGDIVFPHRPYPTQRVVVPRGHVWVEGDNWRDSIDSHDFGPISKNLITGKAMRVIIPFDRRGEIPEPKRPRKVIPRAEEFPDDFE